MTSFEKFIKEQNDLAKNKKEFNAPATIDKFRSLISNLYDKIDNDWLKAFIENGDITTGVLESNITEEKLGTYNVNEKWIEIGGKRIMLCPIGTILIGTDARVDMEYRSKNIMIVHVGENVDGFEDMLEVKVNGVVEKKAKAPGKSIWKVVESNGHTVYRALNADVFQKIIMEIVK